jgi:hypothetical protein
MLDLDALSPSLLDALKNRGHTEDAISKMAPEYAFAEYCAWHGLLNWGDNLWQAVHQCKAANTVAKEMNNEDQC